MFLNKKKGGSPARCCVTDPNKQAGDLPRAGPYARRGWGTTGRGLGVLRGAARAALAAAARCKQTKNRAGMSPSRSPSAAAVLDGICVSLSLPPGGCTSHIQAVWLPRGFFLGTTGSGRSQTGLLLRAPNLPSLNFGGLQNNPAPAHTHTHARSLKNSKLECFA